MRRRRDVSLPVAAAFAFFVAGSPAASADCRGEVEAAFQKLEKPDRPYRSEVTIVGGYRATIEFIPPDRLRLILNSANDWLQAIPGGANWLRRILAYFAGPDPIETIQIGNRTWKRVNRKWLEYGSPKLSPTGFPPLEITSETAFACLGDIAFEGKTYAGYRISFPPTGGAVVVQFGADINKTQEEVSMALKNAPPIWRTILVDRETALPENQVLSDKDQLDSPLMKVHYTYPSDLTIEPPAQ